MIAPPMVSAGEPVELTLARPASLEGFFVLSPYVRADDGGYELFVRVVNAAPDPAEKVARVHRGHSDDGQRFTLDEPAVIAPGPGALDDGGCEDPTVLVESGAYTVYYSGYDRTRKRSTLLRATGASGTALSKGGEVLPHDPRFANAKEASYVAGGGRPSLYFEYARDDASRIGRAVPDGAGGWRYADSAIEARPDRWDAFHLSPGPAVMLHGGRWLLFYNGATADAHWRIGWVLLEADGAAVVARSNEPLVMPAGIGDGETDIAFAASAVTLGDAVWLYYSIADRRLMRTTLHVGTP